MLRHEFDARQLQQLSEAALLRYPIEQERVQFLGHRDTVTFKVAAGNESYLLKIHTAPDRARMPAIESELIWLEALSNDTGLVVPVPVRSKDDRLVTGLEHEGGVELKATLLRWVEGDVLNRQPTFDEAQRLGGLMAALHRHSAYWNLTEGFDRPAYRSEALTASVRQLSGLLQLGIIRQEDYRTIEQTANDIAAFTSKLERTKQTWGLIHSDLHESNYVVHQQEVRPIDFSCCGFGYYLFDVAESLLHLYPDNRKAFLQRYKQARSLATVDERTVEAFFIWQVIRGYAFHSTNPKEHAWLSGSVPKLANDYCRRYTAGEPFLFI